MFPALQIPAVKTVFKRLFQKTSSSGDSEENLLLTLSKDGIKPLLEEFFRQKGYQVDKNQDSGFEGEIDFILRMDGEVMIVNCDRWNEKETDAAPLLGLVGDMEKNNADACLLVTSGEFTLEAMEFADDKPCVLMDGETLMDALQDVAPPQPVAENPPEPEAKTTSVHEPAPVPSTDGDTLSLSSVISRIESVQSLREALKDSIESFKNLIGCEFAGFFAVDLPNREMYSLKIGDMETIEEVRLGISRESLPGYSAAAGTIVYIEDTANLKALEKYDPGLRLDDWWNFYLDFKPRSVLAMPLTHNKKLIGVLEAINKPDGVSFSMEDIRLAKEFSPVMGTAVYKIMLETVFLTGKERKVDREEKIHAITQAIHSVDNVDKILIEHKDSILQFFEAGLITIYAVADGEKEIYSKIKSGNEVNEIRVPISPASIAGCGAFLKKPLNIRDVYDEAELKRIHPELSFNASWEKKIKAMLVYPLVCQNQTMGVLQLINKKNGGEFDASDEKYAKMIADTLALGFHNMRREEKIRSITQAIHAAGNVDEILIELKDSILDLFNAGLITIYAIAPGGEDIYSKIKSGDTVNDIRVPISPASIAGCAAFLKKPLNIRDVYDETELNNIHPELSFNASWEKKIKAMLVYPLVFKDQLQGVVQLINKNHGGDFDSSDEKYAKMIADTLALGFHNMYRESKIRAITQAIHAARNVDEILIELALQILELFDANLITLYAVDRNKNEIYSKIKTGALTKEIRVPISPNSIAGAAAALKIPINIKDVYDSVEVSCVHPQTRFDSSWDEKTGNRTKSMLAWPLLLQAQLMGVMQVINKNSEAGFDSQDEKNATIIADTLALGIHNQAIHDKEYMDKYGFSS